jgi:hypothetical protein
MDPSSPEKFKVSILEKDEIAGVRLRELTVAETNALFESTAEYTVVHADPIRQSCVLSLL